MAPFVARTFLWLILAFFLFETIEEFNQLFSLSINVYFAIVPVALIYGLHEIVMKKKEVQGEKVTTKRMIEAGFGRAIYITACFFILILFVFIILVWSGVIYKAISE